jgi:hypothetical protein
MYPDSEILFPSRCIPELRDLRGEKWAELVDHLQVLPDGHEDILAISLLIINESSCLTCDLDSYRASLGCCTCAARTISGFKGSDEELIELFEEMREEVRDWLATGQLSEALSVLVVQPE